MSDYIVHASGAGNQVRIFAASTRDLVEKAREIHNTSPVATARQEPTKGINRNRAGLWLMSFHVSPGAV